MKKSGCTSSNHGKDCQAKAFRRPLRFAHNLPTIEEYPPYTEMIQMSSNARSYAEVGHPHPSC